MIDLIFETEMMPWVQIVFYRNEDGQFIKKTSTGCKLWIIGSPHGHDL